MGVWGLKNNLKKVSKKVLTSTFKYVLSKYRNDATRTTRNQMPYINKEQVASKRKQIKAAFPDFKFSVTNSNHTGIDVAIMQGPVDLCDANGLVIEYQQLNRFYAEDLYHTDLAQIVLAIVEICKEGQRPGFEDADYGYVPNWYVTVNVGKWNKNYKKVGSKNA